MKKLTLLFTLCLIASVAANAQEFKKFRWAVGLGYAKPAGDGAGGGFPGLVAAGKEGRASPHRHLAADLMTGANEARDNAYLSKNL